MRQKRWEARLQTQAAARSQHKPADGRNELEQETGGSSGALEEMESAGGDAVLHTPQTERQGGTEGGVRAEMLRD